MLESLRDAARQAWIATDVHNLQRVEDGLALVQPHLTWGGGGQ